MSSYNTYQREMRYSRSAIPTSPVYTASRPLLLDDDAPAISPAEMHLEIKHLEERTNKLGYTEIIEPGTPAPEVYSSGKYGAWPMVILRKFSQNGVYSHSTLDIKSPYIKDVLAEVIGTSYPGWNFRQKVIPYIPLPARMFFYWMDDIEEACGKLEEAGKRREHVELFVGWLKREFGDAKREMDSLLREGMITSELLWTIFKPGTIIYTIATTDHPQCGLLILASGIGEGSYNISFRSISHDGNSFGFEEDTVKIYQFPGSIPLTSLTALPLSLHPSASQIRESLIARGRIFESLNQSSYEYRYYNGLMYQDSHTAAPILKTTIKGPVIVDVGTYLRINPTVELPYLDYNIDIGSHDTNDISDTDSKLLRNFDFDGYIHPPPPNSQYYPPVELSGPLPLPMRQNISSRPSRQGRRTDSGSPPPLHHQHGRRDHRQPNVPARPIPPPADPKHPQKPLNDIQLLLCVPSTFGFSLTSKRWGELFISSLQAARWDDTAFASLVLPEHQKTLIRSLVESHIATRELSSSSGSSDPLLSDEDCDFITGKSHGLVAILHGPPGVGKTLTAEAVSHAVHRPLYSISASDLGTTPSSLESKLTNILSVATTWNAILLLDEADVFLAARRPTHAGDLARNGMVSVFLRMLEYFEGILILTTNLTGAIDPAFWSRVHVALKYEKLEAPARRKVWKGFLKGEVGEEELDRLEELKCSGRVIRNAVRTARALSMRENGGGVSVERLEMCVGLMAEFEERGERGGEGR